MRCRCRQRADPLSGHRQNDTVAVMLPNRPDGGRRTLLTAHGRRRAQHLNTRLDPAIAFMLDHGEPGP